MLLVTFTCWQPEVVHMCMFVSTGLANQRGKITRT